MAIEAVRKFCDENIGKIDIVRFVLFDPRTYAAYERAVKETGINSKETLREQTISELMFELKKGENSIKNDEDWNSEESVLSEFGVTL